MTTNSPPISRQSSNWRPLKSWLTTQIQLAQERLEATTTREPHGHCHDRGRIAAYRDLIAAVEPETKPEGVEEGRDYLGAGESLDYDV